MNKYVTRLRKQIANTVLAIVIIIDNIDYIEIHNFKTKYITLKHGRRAVGVQGTFYLLSAKLIYPPDRQIHVRRSRSLDRA